MRFNSGIKAGTRVGADDEGTKRRGEIGKR
jgi:hypothetical protein